MDRLGLAVLVAAALVPASAAHAKITIKMFQTPSENIQCGFFGEGKRASVRCDIREQDNPVKPRPQSCEFDYGKSYGVNKRGKAHRLCVSDAVGGPGTPKIQHGETRKFRGIRCKATVDFLRCENRSGHGFKLSRAAQTLF